MADNIDDSIISPPIRMSASMGKWHLADMSLRNAVDVGVNATTSWSYDDLMHNEGKCTVVDGTNRKLRVFPMRVSPDPANGTIEVLIRGTDDIIVDKVLQKGDSYSIRYQLIIPLPEYEELKPIA